MSSFLSTLKCSFAVPRPETKPKGYPEYPQTLGERIRKHRMDLGLYQKDVARFLEVSTDTVNYWEKGRVKPRRKRWAGIDAFLRVSSREKVLSNSSDG